MANPSAVIRGWWLSYYSAAWPLWLDKSRSQWMTKDPWVIDSVPAAANLKAITNCCYNLFGVGTRIKIIGRLMGSSKQRNRGRKETKQPLSNAVPNPKTQLSESVFLDPNSWLRCHYVAVSLWKVSYEKPFKFLRNWITEETGLGVGKKISRC